MTTEIEKKEEAIKLSGVLTVTHLNEKGEVIREDEYKNLIVSAGKAGMASRLNGDGAEAVFTHIAIGTGTTGEAVTQTALASEITTGGGQRAVASVSRITTTVTNDTARWIITFNFTASFAVTESGIFNAASAGTMLARRVFAAYNVTSGDALQFTWRVQAT